MGTSGDIHMHLWRYENWVRTNQMTAPVFACSPNYVHICTWTPTLTYAIHANKFYGLCSTKFTFFKFHWVYMMFPDLPVLHVRVWLAILPQALLTLSYTLYTFPTPTASAPPPTLLSQNSSLCMTNWLCVHLYVLSSNTSSCVVRPFSLKRRLALPRTPTSSMWPSLSQTLLTSTIVWRLGNIIQILWVWLGGSTPRGRLGGNSSSMIWEEKELRFKSWQMQGWHVSEFSFGDS